MALKVRLSSLTRAIYSHYCGFISALAHGFLSSDAFYPAQYHLWRVNFPFINKFLWIYLKFKSKKMCI